MTGEDKLFEYLKSKNPLVRFRTVEVIGRIQDPVDAPRLVPLLHDPDPNVVQETIFSLGQLGSTEVVSALIETGRTGSPDLLPAVAEALGKIGGDEAIVGLE